MSTTVMPGQLRTDLVFVYFLLTSKGAPTSGSTRHCKILTYAYQHNDTNLAEGYFGYYETALET